MPDNHSHDRVLEQLPDCLDDLDRVHDGLKRLAADCGSLMIYLADPGSEATLNAETFAKLIPLAHSITSRLLDEEILGKETISSAEKLRDEITVAIPPYPNGYDEKTPACHPANTLDNRIEILKAFSSVARNIVISIDKALDNKSKIAKKASSPDAVPYKDGFRIALSRAVDAAYKAADPNKSTNDNEPVGEVVDLFGATRRTTPSNGPDNKTKP